MKIRLIRLLFLSALLFLQSCYLLKQGTGQIKLRLAQVPLEQAIESEQNQKYKDLLLAVPEIKQYAVNQLGLKQNDNYTTYYWTSEEGVAYVVTASPKDKLLPYTWWFPIIGSVPYKGYFKKSDALELEEDLKREGYDTWLFAAPAYSTLGWFNDPLTTPMLNRGYYSLVATLIHEMVHTTVYIEGEGDFNEQLASFVEDKGTIGYFRYRGLLKEETLQQLKARKDKRRSFATIINKYLAALTELYVSDSDPQSILNQRDVLFTELEKEVVQVYPGRSEEFWKFNNARLLQYRRYQGDNKLFNDFWLQSGKNWKNFWQLVRGYVEKQGWDS